MKENPYFPRHAEAFSPEAVNFLMNLTFSPSDIGRVQDLAYLSIVVYTAMRNIDVYNLKSSNCKACFDEDCKDKKKVKRRYFTFKSLIL
jgi:hypothetical protein